MAQHDMNIANQGFPAFRADLNSALTAIANNSSGATAPSTTFAYQWWYDTSTNALKMRNADNDAWIEIGTFNQTTDSFTPSGVTTDSISEGNSSVDVVDSGTGYVAVTVDGVETARFDANGRLGIGTTNTSDELTVYDSIKAIQTDSANTSAIALDFGADIARLRSTVNGSGVQRPLGFFIGGAESMRIDSSGNLLVGTTDTELYSSSAANNTADGFLYRGNGVGLTTCSRYNGNPLALNRTGSDGDIAVFRKDGSTVGSIGTEGADLWIGNNNVGVQFIDNTAGTRALRPFDPSTNSRSDNTTDLGQSTTRFDDVYATNGTIQTSDANEKQDIAELDEAEQRVAQACKCLLRKFRWKDSVAEKGDDARIHFGIIAQDLQAAFETEGLDAGKYAMFISTTWWETTEEVPAVEAVEATYDEEGNVLTDAVEAKDAYTRTNHYDTAEEAPEGAVERTRLGVRYPELLAFIIAAL